MIPLRAVTRRVTLLVGIFIVALCAGWVPPAEGQLYFTDPNLPPESNPPDCENLLSVYTTQGDFAVFPGPIVFNNIRHKCFQNVYRQAMGNDELETFDSIMDVLIDLGEGPVETRLTGPTTTRTYNRMLSTAGTFSAEIVSMDLSGTVGGTNVRLQESPTLTSSGQTDILDIGGGLYQIDSFFDVFTELSVNAGPWAPQTNQAFRIVLVNASMVPVEASTWGKIKALYQ
jgi:hypothetical protein